MTDNSYAPFNTKEGRDSILLFWNNKLMPQLSKLQKLLYEVAEYRPCMVHILNRSKIKSLESTYNANLKDFLEIYRIFKAPIFEGGIFSDAGVDHTKPENQQIIAEMSADYMITGKQMLNEPFSEGFSLIDIIDKQLTRRRQILDNYLTVSLSISAIIISILIAVA